MWKRLFSVWRLVKTDARLLWMALRHPSSPSWLKIGTGLLAVYLVMPIDLIPDVILGFGWMDDLVLIPLAINFMLRRLPAHVLADVKAKAGLQSSTPR